MCCVFSLCLSPRPVCSLSPAALRSELLAVCLGPGFVRAQEMPLGSWTPNCSWLFAGIQSLSLPGSDQLPILWLLPGLEGDRGAGRLAEKEGQRCEARAGEGHQGLGHVWGPLRAVSAGWDKGLRPWGQTAQGEAGERFSLPFLPPFPRGPPSADFGEAPVAGRPPQPPQGGVLSLGLGEHAD